MHPNETAIHDYVDETLEPRERADVERHLAACGECHRLVDDLREIRSAMAGLKDDLREPPVRAWARLERAIRLEPVAEKGSYPFSAGKAFWKRGTTPFSQHTWLAAAAALVLATLAGLQFRPGRQATRTANGTAPAPTSAASSASTGEAAQMVEAELRAAEDHYTKAITGLEHIARAEQGALDPGTAATLQKNLAVIDQAISESRAALRTQPASEPAQVSLVENFKAKIALLQDTVALINEMRKGNEAGAARIVSGLKPKGD